MGGGGWFVVVGVPKMTGPSFVVWPQEPTHSAPPPPSGAEWLALPTSPPKLNSPTPHPLPPPSPLAGPWPLHGVLPHHDDPRHQRAGPLGVPEALTLSPPPPSLRPGRSRAKPTHPRPSSLPSLPPPSAPVRPRRTVPARARDAAEPHQLQTATPTVRRWGGRVARLSSHSILVSLYALLPCKDPPWRSLAEVSPSQRPIGAASAVVCSTTIVPTQLNLRRPIRTQKVAGSMQAGTGCFVTPRFHRCIDNLVRAGLHWAGLLGASNWLH